MRYATLLAATASLAAGASGAQLCSPAEMAKLLASDGASGDDLGQAVAISGDIAVLGAYDDDDNGTGSGSAYVYRFDGTNWVQEAKLIASEGAAGDRFGWSVAVSGDTIAVGAINDDSLLSNSGAVYIFRHDGTNWVEEAELFPSGALPQGKQYARNIALSGDVLVVAQQWDSTNGPFAGAAYAYRFNGTGWTEEAFLLASDGADQDTFSHSVAVSGDTIVVGAIFDEMGSAYVFRFDGAGWVQEQKLLASDGQMSDRFGSSVAVDGNTIVVGAEQADGNEIDSGSAYVYTFDGTSWSEQAEIFSAVGTEDDNFGRGIALDGDTIVVGVLPLGQVGLISVFHSDGTNWIDQGEFTSTSPLTGGFGNPVAIDGNTALIGAQASANNGGLSGAGIIFDLGCMTTCLPDVNGDGMVTPTDFTAWINAFNNNLPACDQNGDGACTPTDFTAWIANFNAGCP